MRKAGRCRTDNYKRSLLMRWSLSYLLICLIPILIFILFAVFSSTVLFRSINNSTRVALDSITRQLDAAIGQNNSLCDDLLTNSSFNNLKMKERHEITVQNLYDTSMDFNHILNGYAYIEDAAVTSLDKDLYVTGLRWGTINEMYLRNELDLPFTAEEFADIYSGVPLKMLVLDASRTFYGGTRIPRLVVIRPLSFIRSQVDGAFVVSTIINLSSVLPDNLSDYHSLIVLSSYTGEILFDYSGRYSTGDYVDALATLSSGDTTLLDGRIATAGASAFSGLRYVIMVEKGVYYRDTFWLIVLGAILLILSIALSLVFIFHRVRSEWEAYDSAVKVFGRPVDRSRIPKDQYDTFREMGQTMKDEQAVMGALIESQTKYLKESTIMKLVDNKGTPVSEEALKECGITFLSDSFCVLIVAAEEKERTDVEGRTVAALDGMKAKVFPFSSPCGLAFIVSLPSSSSSFYGALEAAMETLMGECDAITRASSSDLVRGIESLGGAYIDAVNVIEYLRMASSREFMVNRDVVDVINKTDFSYTTQDEISLEEKMENGNEVAALKLVEGLVERNTGAGSSPRAMRYLLFSIMGTVIRTANRMERQYGLDLPAITFSPIIHSEDFSASLKEVEEVISRTIRSINSFRSGNVTEDAYAVYKRALLIVQEEYSDSMLNVSKLAEKLGVSNVSLSKIFKKYHGSNISDYLSSYRIMMAKKLLADGKSVAEVVSGCGFGSMRTLLRLFKNQENITLGQFRAMRQEGKTDV